MKLNSEQQHLHKQNRMRPFAEMSTLRYNGRIREQDNDINISPWRLLPLMVSDVVATGG